MSDAREHPAPRRRVIVAEDDPFMRQLVVAALERDGYLVEEVRSGIGLHDELFSRITRGETPALIISDIQMPVLDGLEVVRRLRAWGEKVPVIIMTAYADEQTLASAAEAGVDAVLAKPFTMTELCTTAQRLVPSDR
jgi:CheY-like chemotaxis protein